MIDQFTHRLIYRIKQQRIGQIMLRAMLKRELKYLWSMGGCG